MQIDTLPVHAPVPDPASGEQRQVAAALLLMNDPADDGRTTGWYWSQVPRNPEQRDLKSRQRWTSAVANHHGPFRDANTALAAAGNHTPQATELAARLGQAAELLRAGEIDATPAAIAGWLAETEGAGDPIGPDPDARPAPEDADELRRTLGEGEVPEPDDETGDAEDAPLEVHDTSTDTAESG